MSIPWRGVAQRPLFRRVKLNALPLNHLAKDICVLDIDVLSEDDSTSDIQIPSRINTSYFCLCDLGFATLNGILSLNPRTLTLLSSFPPPIEALRIRGGHNQKKNYQVFYVFAILFSALLCLLLLFHNARSTSSQPCSPSTNSLSMNTPMTALSNEFSVHQNICTCRRYGNQPVLCIPFPTDDEHGSFHVALYGPQEHRFVRNCPILLENMMGISK